MAWEQVKGTTNPLWERGYRFFCSTPKSRHSTHSSWSVVDWHWLWSCNFGDPLRADKRAPGVADRQIQMNPDAARPRGRRRRTVPRCRRRVVSSPAVPDALSPELAPLRFEPRLVEEAVRLILERGAIGVAAAALTRLRLTHRRRLDEIYDELPGEAREAAFREHYRSLFGKLGLDRLLQECLEPSPVLRLNLREVLVRTARPPGNEGAELWEHRSERGRGIRAYLVVSLTPARFRDSVEMASFLRSRLRRAADLLASPRGDDGGPGSEAPREGPPGAVGDGAETKSRCPLCAFPTMVWASPEVLAGARVVIQRDFPRWRTVDGCCEHCADRYVGLAATGAVK